MHDVPPKFIHLADIIPRPTPLRTWERQRHRRAHLLVECMAECVGVFIYTFAGVGSTASMVIGTIANQPYLGSLLQVGIAYAIGIVLALSICASTSGGHINPCVTIAFTLFKGFPLKKAPFYILSQILGAYIACLIVYLQWRTNILAAEEALAATGALNAIQFTPNGPAGIIGLYTLPGANLGVVFANEFFADFFLGLAIWGCIDPSNFYCPPSVAPYSIGLAYAIVIWGFAPNALAANSARDVGGRLAALTLWGTEASGGRYAAIAALTNIPAMLLAALFYEFFFHDSSRVLPPAQRDFLFGHKAHDEHSENTHGLGKPLSPQSSVHKAEVEHEA
ncbi:hypothetical protein ACEPAG_7136 [Sanghuangporus baumii]